MNCFLNCNVVQSSRNLNGSQSSKDGKDESGRKSFSQKNSAEFTSRRESLSQKSMSIRTNNRLLDSNANDASIAITEDILGEYTFRGFIKPETRQSIGKFVTHGITRMVVIVLIITDLILVTYELSTEETVEAAIIFEYCMIGFLLIEVLLRIIYLDIKAFFKNKFYVLDLAVTIGAAALMPLDNFLISIAVGGRLLLQIARALRVFCMTLKAGRDTMGQARRVVSQNRRRYVKDGFDLDVTYVTSRVLAMSVPATNFESFYRNHEDEVARFFVHHHNMHFLILNLCPERHYNYRKFDSRVLEQFMPDHNVAPLQTVLETCKNIHDYLSKDSKNVIAVHCKGGKGRTGLIVCSFLLYCGVFDTADKVLEYFAQRRTSADGEREGVENCCQTRYVQYMQKVAQRPGKTIPVTKPWQLLHIRVHSLASVTDTPGNVWFVVSRGFDSVIYSFDEDQRKSKKSLIKASAERDYVDFIIPRSSHVLVQNDVLISFFLPPIKKDASNLNTTGRMTATKKLKKSFESAEKEEKEDEEEAKLAQEGVSSVGSHGIPRLSADRHGSFSKSQETKQIHDGWLTPSKSTIFADDQICFIDPNWADKSYRQRLCRSMHLLKRHKPLCTVWFHTAFEIPINQKLKFLISDLDGFKHTSAVPDSFAIELSILDKPLPQSEKVTPGDAPS
jgi:protein-tyrosine phosphatase